MPAPPTSAPTAQSAPSGPSRLDDPEFRRLAILLMLGWAGTNIGLSIATLPLRLKVLIGEMHLEATAIATFFAIGHFSNYVKPLAGVLTDAVPFLGSRRRGYLMVSLGATAFGWMLLNFVPRQYHWMLITYTLMYIGVVFTSTTLGGVMVEVGNRYRAAGRLTAQRIAMFKVGGLIGGPLGGFFSQFTPFVVATGTCAAFHLGLIPFFRGALKDDRASGVDRNVLEGARQQWRALIGSKTLLGAALMIAMIAAAPGLGTPLTLYQKNVLKFDDSFIGSLELIAAGTGLLAAGLYFRACRVYNLRFLIIASVLIHATGTLLYLFYYNMATAILVTALEGLTVTFAMLPVYDIAARATPKGSEAMGYAVMMSVWNLTNAFSDIGGSLIKDYFRLDFHHLVWVNASTTLLDLLVVPFMPKVLTLREDEHAAAMAAAEALELEGR